MVGLCCCEKECKGREEVNMTSRPLIRCIGSFCGSPDCPRCYPGCDTIVTCGLCGEDVYICYIRFDDGLCDGLCDDCADAIDEEKEQEEEEE